MQITNFCLPIFAAMGFQFFADYFKHQLTAKSRHGTHSPFVYKLADEVIYDFSSKKVYQDMEEKRKKLLNDDRLITVTDLGAGLYSTKEQKKTVGQLARKALKTPRLAQLIYRLAANRKLEHIIELGTCLGITTAYLAKAKPEATILTIESGQETAQIAQQNFTELDLKNIELRVGHFNDLLPKAVQETEKLDFVYVGGHQTKEVTINYFNWCLPKVDENSLLIFDDIYRSEEMKLAWEIIKTHPQVTVTIDLFWLGLVYFRKGQAKEHFKLKF